MADLGAVGRSHKVSYYVSDRAAGSGALVLSAPVGGRLVVSIPVPPLSVLYRRMGRPARVEATWALSEEYPFLFYTPSGNLRGTIKQDGVVLPNCLVAVYYRRTLQLVASQYSKVDGTFRFDNLIQGEADFFIVAFDPEGGLLQNAIILDKLTPT